MMFSIYEHLESVYQGEDLELVHKAFDFSKEAHKNQKRASGEEYFIHPCFVARILVDLGLDASTVAAAFLHDVIEDTPVSEGDIKNIFGDPESHTKNRCSFNHCTDTLFPKIFVDCEDIVFFNGFDCVCR